MVTAFANNINLKSIEKHTLDSFLNIGWFRNGNKIFTTQFLNHNDVIHDAIWLRIDLNNFSLSKSQESLFKKNFKFKTSFNKFILTQEKEILFKKYRDSVAFIRSQSLLYVLFDDEKSEVFDTHEICVYDEDKLIALGIYDKGMLSSAGITCIFDPDYKKFSLGKYLMLHKILKLQGEGYTYFYPGYIAPGFSAFDYKLTLSKTCMEYYDLPSRLWKNYKYFNEDNTLLNIFTRNLSELSNVLKLENISHSIYQYPYFDAKLNSAFQDINTIQDPMFILIKNYRHENDFIIIIIYDVILDTYKVLECYTIGYPSIPSEGHNFYSKAILEISDVLTSFKVLDQYTLMDLKKFSLIA